MQLIKYVDTCKSISKHHCKFYAILFGLKPFPISHQLSFLSILLGHQYMFFSDYLFLCILHPSLEEYIYCYA